MDRLKININHAINQQLLFWCPMLNVAEDKHHVIKMLSVTTLKAFKIKIEGILFRIAKN